MDILNLYRSSILIDEKIQTGRYIIVINNDNMKLEKCSVETKMFTLDGLEVRDFAYIKDDVVVIDFGWDSRNWYYRCVNGTLTKF